MGAFLQWLDEWAKLIVPGTLLSITGLWINRSAKKTRELNTEEHAANHALLVEAIKWSKESAEGVSAVDGRLTTYIEEHQKVHDRLIP